MKKHPGSTPFVPKNVFAPSLNKCYKHRENLSLQISPPLINVPHKKVKQKQFLKKDPHESLLVAENESADILACTCSSEQNIVHDFSSSTSVM